MYIYFLVEDLSGGCLIDNIMKKYNALYQRIYYDIKSFKGIGKFPLKQNIQDDVKTRRLLDDLALYLRGFSKSLVSMGDAASIFVILDCDTRNCREFRTQLDKILQDNMIQINTVFCIAIEEMESWLLGDQKAILSAYPSARLSAMKDYEQDSIVGSWELLADVVYKGGRRKMFKDCPTYPEKGKLKCEWANQIGVNIDIERNNSYSFRRLIRKLHAINH